MEERLRERVYGAAPEPAKKPQAPQPPQTPQAPQVAREQQSNQQNEVPFQTSIASRRPLPRF